MEYVIDIEKLYASSLDSVDLIHSMYDLELTSAEEDLETISRNKEHLELMVQSGFWDSDDLEPFIEAINRVE